MAKKKAAEAPKEKRPKGMAALVKSYHNSKVHTDLFFDPKASEKINCLNSGSYIVNKILGLPGIPKGRIGEIYGLESSGKSTLVTVIALTALKAKKKVLYLDFEQAFDVAYAKKLGLDIDDPDHFALARPTTFEEGWAICRDFLDNVPDLDMIVVDSVAAMTPKAILEAAVDKTAQIGLQARMLSQFCAEMTKKIRKTDTAMVVVNQIRSRIKTNMYDPGPETDTSGGKALKFYASWRLELIRGKLEEVSGVSEVDASKVDKAVALRVKAINRKNKVSDPHKKGEFVIRFGDGIDNLASIIDICMNINVIKKDGASFSFSKDIAHEKDPEYFTKESGKIVGYQKLRNYILNTDTVQKQLLEAIKNFDLEKEESKEDSIDEIPEEVLLEGVEPVSEDVEASLQEEQEKSASKRGRKKKSAEEPTGEAVEEEIA